MQITSAGETGHPRLYSTEEISVFLDFVRDNLRITDQEHIRALLEGICKEVGSLGIGFTVRSAKLAVDLGERLLSMHMKDNDERKLRSLVENMSRRFQSHAYPISRPEAMDIGLPILDPSDPVLDDLMWAAWLEIEKELKERTPFNPLLELLNSGEAATLLAPVPQLALPVNAPSPNHFQATLKDVTGAIKEVKPIDFETKIVLVDSTRTTHILVSRGKILACRLPNLVIHFNAVTTFRGWEQTSG